MSPDLEQRLRSALRAEAGNVHQPADLVARIERRRSEDRGRRGGHRRSVRLAIATVIVLVLGVGVATVRSNRNPEGNVTDVGDDSGPRDESIDSTAEVDPKRSTVPGSQALQADLLTLDDMPAGWVDRHFHYSAVEYCMRTEMPADGPAADEYPAAAAAYSATGNPGVPDVWEKLVAAPPGQGNTVFSSARSALRQCGDGGDVDDYTYLGAVDLAVPALGDEAVGRRFTIRYNPTGAVVGADAIYIRSGDTIIAVGVVEPEGQIDRLVELATLALDRVNTSS